MNRPTTTFSDQHGLTLIEVLVAIVLIAFGLLAVASMQITGLKNNQSAHYRATATVFAYDILDRMRANKKALVAGSYHTGGSFIDGITHPEATAPWQSETGKNGKHNRKLPSIRQRKSRS